MDLKAGPTPYVFRTSEMETEKADTGNKTTVKCQGTTVIQKSFELKVKQMYFCLPFPIAKSFCTSCSDRKQSLILTLIPHK